MSQTDRETWGLRAALDTARAEVAQLRQACAAKDEQIALLLERVDAQTHQTLVGANQTRDAILSQMRHMGITPHCDWQGHPPEQVVGTELSLLLCDLERKDAALLTIANQLHAASEVIAANALRKRVPQLYDPTDLLEGVDPWL